MADVELEVEIDNSASCVYERSASAPSSPSDRSAPVHRDIGNIGCHANGRRVTFPDDDTIVTGYFEAPDPWGDEFVASADNIVAAYRAASWKQGVKPLHCVLQQLQDAKLQENMEFELNLKGERLESQHCEALEEIFKRLQFTTLVLENCHLDDEGAAAIFDMIEYYDSTSHLNISGNRAIGSQGWQACSKMLKRTPCLQYLDARNTTQNEQSLLILGRAFRTGSNLAVLHLENCGLSGRPLVILIAALKLNTTLVELYLGENKISAADGLQLGNLLRSNSILELLDLRYNNLQDLGVCHLTDGLCQQIPNNGDCLKTLNLSHNHLTQNGMVHINQALLVSTSLCTLDLSHNSIGNEGIHILKQGLLHNQTLLNLKLRDSSITCEGVVTLAEYIADNQRICHLDLKDNYIKVAGIMALSLSMRHNHSITILELDEIIPNDLSTPDGIHDHERLLKEIQDYCSRNKNEADEDSEKNFIPIIHNDAELSVIYPEKTPVYRTASLNPAHPPPIGMVCSASFPAGSKPTQHLSSNVRNRFQVCRVFLEGDSNASVDETVFFPSSPSENSEDSQESSLHETESLKNDLSSNGSEIAINAEIFSCEGKSNDSNNLVNAVQKSSANKTQKKIAFLLPDDADLNTHGTWKDRRMSTPAPASIRLIKDHHNFKLKLGRQLESLDLRSSVPLSPTRLREGLVFPDPFDFKLPTDNRLSD